eukprot:scaffold6694_cov101-Isochrysis_galbana.AAC.1
MLSQVIAKPFARTAVLHANFAMISGHIGAQQRRHKGRVELVHRVAPLTPVPAHTRARRKVKRASGHDYSSGSSRRSGRERGLWDALGGNGSLGQSGREWGLWDALGGNGSLWDAFGGNGVSGTLLAGTGSLGRSWRERRG